MRLWNEAKRRSRSKVKRRARMQFATRPTRDFARSVKKLTKEERQAILKRAADACEHAREVLNKTRNTAQVSVTRRALRQLEAKKRK
jgi:hypothetical protein